MLFVFVRNFMAMLMWKTHKLSLRHGMEGPKLEGIFHWEAQLWSLSHLSMEMHNQGVLQLQPGWLRWGHDRHPLELHQVHGRGWWWPIPGHWTLRQGPLQRFFIASLPSPWAPGQRSLPRRGQAGMPLRVVPSWAHQVWFHGQGATWWL